MYLQDAPMQLLHDWCCALFVVLKRKERQLLRRCGYLANTHQVFGEKRAYNIYISAKCNLNCSPCCRFPKESKASPDARGSKQAAVEALAGQDCAQQKTKEAQNRERFHMVVPPLRQRIQQFMNSLGNESIMLGIQRYSALL